MAAMPAARWIAPSQSDDCEGLLAFLKNNLRWPEMRQLNKRLIAGLAGTLCFATVATGLTLVVRYKPYGVPDHRRAEYEDKLAKIEQRQALLSELKEAAKPIAVVPNKTHDFGMLDPHTTATHSFNIRNEGEHPLALEVRETSCKCTVGNLGSDLLDPGQSTKITLTWNTGYQADKYEQTATLVTNDPVKKLIKLTVKGEVRAELVAPESVAFKASNRGEQTEASFVVYSQLWDDFTVSDVQSDLRGFEWYAEPIDGGATELVDKFPKSAWRVRVFAVSESYGKYSGELSLTVKPSIGGEDVVRLVQCAGRVRAPIGFYSPQIHKNEGLDLGTIKSGRQHDFHLVVRARGEGDRKLEVLDIKPDELTASIAPLEKPGSYRLTVTVPADCPHVRFNLDEQHGYVQVGDKRDRDYSNWFPLRGAVVTVK